MCAIASACRRLLLTFCLVLLPACATGCETTVRPPITSRDPLPFYVADYGRHSSVIIPCGENELLEYAFGDMRWFALGDTRPSVALAAMFGRSQATLGRRSITASGATLAELRKALGANRLLQLCADRARIESLCRRLEARFTDQGRSVIHSKYSLLDHVPDDERYHLFHNCNHVTAGWLRACRASDGAPWRRGQPCAESVPAW